MEECGVIGQLVVEEFATARLQVHPFLHWRRAHHPDAPLGAELLEAFSRVDREAYRPPAYRRYGV